MPSHREEIRHRHHLAAPSPDLLAAAVAVELAADDMQARARAAAAVAVQTAVCDCPDANGYCREDCAHCAALPDTEPCPGDPAPVHLDAAVWTPPPVTEPRPAELTEPPAPEILPSGPPPAELEAGNLPAPAAVSTPRAAHWASRHDPASLAYAIGPTLGGKLPLADVLLADGPVLDQGKEGQCVGFGVADAVNALTLIGGLNRPLVDAAGAHQLYLAARKIDGERPSDPDGTSVLAGMKAGQQAGDWASYLWALGTSDIAQAVMRRMPVVIGVPWWSACYETGPGGLVTGIGGGQLVGGHCLCIIGLRMRGPQGQSGPYFVWRNSWGTGYGDGGNGYIHHRDLAALLHSQGEAAIPR
jgi:hypothetical protein